MAAGEVFIVHQSTVRSGQSHTTEHDSGSAATPTEQQGDWAGNWTTPDLTTPAAGQFLFGYSEYVSGPYTRAGALSQFSIDTGGGHALVGIEGATSWAYNRNSGGATEASRHGAYLDDLASGVDVKVRSGTVLNSSDRVGSYDHGASDLGGLWGVDFGDTLDYLFASSSTTDTGTGRYMNTPRPIDLGTPSALSGGTWQTASFSATDDSRGSTITRSGNTFTIAADSTVLVLFKGQFQGDGGRTCTVVQMEVDGSPYAYATTFNRFTAVDHQVCDIAALVTTGGSSEDVEFLFVDQQAYATNDVDALLKSARFIDLTGQDHVILGKTDADITDIDNTWRVPSFPTGDEIADTGGSLDHDGTNPSRINNQAGEEITVLAGFTQFWDRAGTTNGTRVVPGGSLYLNGSQLNYAVASEYDRGSQSSPDPNTWVAGFSSMAPIVIPSGQYIESAYQDLAQNGGSDDMVLNATDGAAIQFWAIRVDDLGGVDPTIVDTLQAEAVWSAQATDPVAGTLTVDTVAASAVWSAQPTSVVPGVISIDTVQSLATWTAQITNPAPGAIEVATAVATADWSAQDTDPQAGTLEVDTAAVTATWSAEDTSTEPGEIEIDTLAATATWSAQETETVAGVIEITTAVASAVWSAQETVPELELVVRTSAATAVWSAQSTTVVPGAVEADTATATATWTAGETLARTTYGVEHCHQEPSTPTVDYEYDTEGLLAVEVAGAGATCTTETGNASSVRQPGPNSATVG